MADLLDGIARYLQGEGLLAYDPDGLTGDAFVESMPPAPDEVVCLSLYDGGPQDTRNAYDSVRLQVRVRGTADPRPSRARCTAIYGALQGLAGAALPDGTWLILAAARGTPAPMGADSNGRHEHVCNFTLDVSAPTLHRTE